MHAHLPFRPLLAVATAFLLGLSAPPLVSAGNAPATKTGNIIVPRAVARATVPGQPAGAVYLIIENRGKIADRLVAVSSPVSRTGEIHTMAMEGNVMKMREVGEVPLPSAATVSMKPGDGYHVMLMGLKKPLQAGEQVPLTLTFEKSGKLDVNAVVEGGPAAKDSEHGDDAMHMHSGAAQHKQ